MADRPVGNPWLMTLPVSFSIAMLCTAIIVGIIYGTGRTPRPTVTIGIPLLYSHTELQGVLPVKAVVADLAVTFMFVCNFTFLEAIMYTISGFFLGIITFEGIGKRKGIHGFLYFLIMLTMGIVVGILYGLAFGVAGFENIPFAAAMISKVVCVFIAAYLGSHMAMGWTARKIKAHMETQATSAG